MTLVNFAAKPVTKSRGRRPRAHNFFRSAPLVNIHEQGDSYQIQLAVPGIPKEQIQLDVKDEQLIIESTQPTADESAEKTNYLRKEYDFGTFRKVFNLNEEINQEAIHATLENGVLTISLDKKDEAKAIPPRSISIK